MATSRFIAAEELEQFRQLRMPTSKRFIDRTGFRYGRLRVICYGGESCGLHHWVCRCDNDENVVRVSGSHLQSGHTKSCGCYKSDATSTKNVTHGNRHRPEYGVWAGMIQRCTNPRLRCFSRYGALGIRVHESWVRSFEAFFEHVGERPSPEHEIDRIDNNGNYEPDNVRWVTRKVNCRNRRNNVRMTYKGKTMLLVEWAEFLKIPHMVIRLRLRRGYTDEEALSLPYGAKITEHRQKTQADT